jgi:hypothetical protein
MLLTFGRSSARIGIMLRGMARFARRIASDRVQLRIVASIPYTIIELV